MKRHTNVVTVLSLWVVSTMASAQVTTLTYQGNLMAGTGTYLPTGYTCSAGDTTCTSPLPTEPATGTITATFVLDGSVSANDLSLVSDSITASGTSGVSYLITGDLGGEQCAGLSCGGPDGTVTFTTTNGMLTGANVSFDNNVNSYNASNWLIDIGAHGDSLSYQWGNEGSCLNQVPVYPPASGQGYAPYTGSPVNPCTVTVSNSSVGVWSAAEAPEIDPASAVGGLTLLLGGVAVLRGRRSVRLLV